MYHEKISSIDDFRTCFGSLQLLYQSKENNTYVRKYILLHVGKFCYRWNHLGRLGSDLVYLTSFARMGDRQVLCFYVIRINQLESLKKNISPNQRYVLLFQYYLIFLNRAVYSYIYIVSPNVKTPLSDYLYVVEYI